MTATYPSLPKNIRPFDIRRDLIPVADLMERGFGDRLSREGKALVRKMRSSANNKRFKRWARRVAGRVSMPLSGFVWDDAGDVIGNLSFIPFHSLWQHHYLIANVTVRPDYQRQGIGRSLVQRALQDLDTKKLDGVWLQVEDSNQTAIDLYAQIGFQERARRTIWELEPRSSEKISLSPYQQEAIIRVRPFRHWELQKKWLERVYPKAIHWYFPFKLWYMRGSMWGLLAQFLLEIPQIKQWSAIQATGELEGVLTWQSTSGYADRLWLAAPPRRVGAALRAFFPSLTHLREFRRPLRLNYPAGRAVPHLKRAGFSSTRTLIWMKWSGT